MDSNQLHELRLRSAKPNAVFRSRSIRDLLNYVDELNGQISIMQDAADEAALTRARLEAEIAALNSEGEAHLFESLAHDNAFDELKRRDAKRLCVA